MCMLSCFSYIRLFQTICTIALQAPLSMGFSRQESWSGLLCPPPGDLPDPGIKPVSCVSCLASRHFTTEPLGKPCHRFLLLLPLLSRFSRVRLCATLETAAHQALLSLGFSSKFLELSKSLLTICARKRRGSNTEFASVSPRSWLCNRW